MAILGDNFLLKSFSDYYQKLAEVRLAIREKRLVEILTIPESDDPPGGELVVSSLFQKLYTLLRNQQIQIRKQATIDEQKHYTMALYVMAVLTDEVLLLGADWELSGLWQETLMENALFETEDAGSRFFEKAENLIDDRKSWKHRADLAAIFLLAIGLGFRGRYQGPSGKESLQEIRKKLHSKLSQNPATKYLFMDAYQSLLSVPEDPKKNRIASLSKWRNILMIAVLSWLLISTIVWQVLSNRLVGKANEIEGLSQQTTAAVTARDQTNEETISSTELSSAATSDISQLEEVF